MRPLKLIISGFGTYCKKTEIDLEKFGKNGLFLITGDTGSGKTTIFDAITYALFGDLNGQNRSVTMIRSTFATPDVPTEVDLTFEFKGKIYNVKRNPEYQRLAKRGEGLTTQIAEATLTLPDGKVITQNSKVTSAITELLRINKEQFSQIVMIAQGDFQKLLMESTEHRMDIFRNLFKTDYYLKLQNKLQDEEKNIAVDCKNIRNAIGIYLNSIQCDSENTLILELEKIKSNKIPFIEAITVIKKIIEEDSSVKKSLVTQSQSIDAELLKNAEILGIAKNLESINFELSKKQKTLEEENEFNVALNNELNNCKNDIHIREQKEKEYALLAKELEEYDEFENKKKNLGDLQKEIEVKRDALKSSENKELKLQDEKNRLSEELKQLEDDSKNITNLKIEIEKLTETNDLLNQLDKEIRDYEKLYLEYEKSVDLYKSSFEKAEQLDCEYKILRKAFMDEQAGILAEELQEDKPCPVCGAIHHPSPAKKSSKAPSEVELNNSENAAVNAQKFAEEKNRICIQVKAESDSKLNKIFELWEKLSGEKLEKLLEDLSARMEQKKIAVVNELKEKNSLLSFEEEKIVRKDEIKKRLPELDEEILGCSNNKNQLCVSIAGLESSEKGISEIVEKLKATLKYESKKIAEAALDDLNEQIQIMKNKFDKVQKQIIESTGKKAALEGEIKQLQEQLKAGENIDVKAAYETDIKLKNQKQELSDRLQVVVTRYERNIDALKNIEKSAGELEIKESRYMWISSLSKTANGNLSNGKEKIKLETYIQMNYFDRIISHANKRLMIMSDGQYELVRKKEADNLRSQTGLELDVIDHYNGGQRSVKSLSGGESFEASLALALGLSDEVRMSAGGIELDSMFVDEGFGTLDSETLQKAFKALSGITEGNRLVGIISHVDLLKEKIDRQIVVKKERSGGSSVQINV